MLYEFQRWVDIQALVGETIKTITGLDKGSVEVNMYTESGKHFMFYHDQDCCESVDLYDFDGYPDDLVGALITSAEEVTSSDDPDGLLNGAYVESYTWTFYKIETSKGGIWMRWLGYSNGYYSESVNIEWVNMTEQEYDDLKLEGK